MESSESNKYQDGVGAKTVANLVSGRFGKVEADDMLKQQRTNLLLGKAFALAIVDSRHHRFFMQKLGDSDEP